jgi:dCTP deaminase
MVLSKKEILAAVKNGELAFTPAIDEELQLGPTNVDLRLDSNFTIFKPASGITISLSEGLKALGSAEPWVSEDLPEFDEFGKLRSFPIAPGEFVLARTLEIVTIPPDLIGMVEGRSSYARLGLSMHQTAPWIHPGYNNKITLEIRNSGSLTINLTPKIDRPCQLTFLRMSESVESDDLYHGQFQKAKDTLKV